MKLPKETGSAFATAPEGNHLSVCFQVIDLGTQKRTFADGVKMQRIIQIGWELSHEMMDDGRPFMVSCRYNFSMNEKAILRRHLESWRGKKFSAQDFGDDGFDIRNLIGKGCFVQVVHNESQQKTYANVASIASLPKGTETPKAVNPHVYFSLEPEEFDPSVFESLHERLRETIAQSPEYQSLTAGLPKAESPQERNARFEREVAEFQDDDSPPF